MKRKTNNKNINEESKAPITSQHTPTNIKMALDIEKEMLKWIENGGWNTLNKSCLKHDDKQSRKDLWKIHGWKSNKICKHSTDCEKCILYPDYCQNGLKESPVYYAMYNAWKNNDKVSYESNRYKLIKKLHKEIFRAASNLEASTYETCPNCEAILSYINSNYIAKCENCNKHYICQVFEVSSIIPQEFRIDTTTETMPTNQIESYHNEWTAVDWEP